MQNRQPLKGNWFVADCLPITPPVINVASVILALPLSRGAEPSASAPIREASGCAALQRFPSRMLVTPLTAGRPLTEGGGRASLSPWRAGLQFAGVTGRWQRLLVLPSRAEAGSALTRLPRAGQAPRIAPLTQGGAPRCPPRGAKAWLFTQWGSHAIHRPASGQPCLSFPLCVCLLLRTFLNRQRNRDNHKLNIGLSLVFDTIVNIKDYGPCLLIFILILFYSFLFFFPFIFINWRLITLQYCSGFCHTLT